MLSRIVRTRPKSTLRLRRLCVQVETPSTASSTITNFPWRLETSLTPPITDGNPFTFIIRAVHDLLSSHFVRICAPTSYYYDTDFMNGADRVAHTTMKLIFNSKIEIEIMEITLWSNGWQINGGEFRGSKGLKDSMLLANLLQGDIPEEFQKEYVTLKLKFINKRDEAYNVTVGKSEEPAPTVIEEAMAAVIEEAAVEKASVNVADKKPKTECDGDDQVYMKDAFEANLARFYEDAISKSRAEGLRIHHKILKIHPVNVERFDSIFNANRAMPKEMSRMVRSDFMNVIGNAEPRDALNITETEGLMDAVQECITARVTVSIGCTEVFYVEEESTGRVVQGSKEVCEGVLHELTLECCMHTSKRRFITDWQVVDIDNWLGGNEFLKRRVVDIPKA